MLAFFIEVNNNFTHSYYTQFWQYQSKKLLFQSVLVHVCYNTPRGTLPSILCTLPCCHFAVACKYSIIWNWWCHEYWQPIFFRDLFRDIPFLQRSNKMMTKFVLAKACLWWILACTQKCRKGQGKQTTCNHCLHSALAPQQNLHYFSCKSEKKSMQFAS